ncbi:pentatricopeptide repeat-containing protein At4g02750 [Selaginella moellendorffii]|nr:pentatricopeptide repeat-containing protein At4g02750 [Selaginella moellendorffii]|eukprot:XP_024537308.1 pentatricopeptide repeat-containing protein At4g02750 [Selaginella moellendorffii]
MYGSCGNWEAARAVFDGIKEPNVFSWNLLIKAYATNGFLREARLAFEGAPQKNAVTWTSLFGWYAKGGLLQEASRMFEKMPEWDFISWTSMFTAYAQSWQPQVAKGMFDRMPSRDAACWNAMFTACAQNGSLVRAKTVFERMPQWNVQSWNGMITAYAQDGGPQQSKNPFEGGDILSKSRLFSWSERSLLRDNSTGMTQEKDHCREARSLFDGIPERNGISWAAMIGAYAKKGKLVEAQGLFQRMPSLDLVTCTTMLEAYAQHGYTKDSKALFDRMPEHDMVSRTAMVLGYAINGELHEARELFDSMPRKDVISWNVIISAYAHKGQDREALELFWRMDVKPDCISFLVVLDVCANSTILEQGKRLHARAISHGLDSNAKVATALINMYGKCGLLGVALELFEKLEDKEVMAWTAMVAAYGYNGQGKAGLMVFHRMVMEGVEPDDILYICVLCLCGHAGLYKDGLEEYLSLQGDFGMVPTMEHFVCVADLLGRAGHTSQAQELLESMPFDADGTAWKLLLTNCKLHGDFGRAEIFGEKLLKASPQASATYVLLSHLYRERNLKSSS